MELSTIALIVLAAGFVGVVAYLRKQTTPEQPVSQEVAPTLAPIVEEAPAKKTRAKPAAKKPAAKPVTKAPAKKVTKKTK